MPKCPGKENCPLKVNHKPNGDECALGCSLCRNMIANAKDFWKEWYKCFNFKQKRAKSS